MTRGRAAGAPQPQGPSAPQGPFLGEQAPARVPAVPRVEAPLTWLAPRPRSPLRELTISVSQGPGQGFRRGPPLAAGSRVDGSGPQPLLASDVANRFEGSRAGRAGVAGVADRGGGGGGPRGRDRRRGVGASRGGQGRRSEGGPGRRDRREAHGRGREWSAGPRAGSGGRATAGAGGSGRPPRRLADLLRPRSSETWG